MVYVFEFFYLDGKERHAIDKMTHRAKSDEQAKDRARSIMRNVKIRDRSVDLCIVKDQRGSTLGEVAANV